MGRCFEMGGVGVRWSCLIRGRRRIGLRIVVLHYDMILLMSDGLL